MKKPTAKALEPIRLYCGECLTEYEVVLEPVAGQNVAGIKSRPVVFCPFCGEGYDVEER